MKVTLKDGSVLNAEKNTTAEQIAMSISEGLARNALAARIDGEVVDLKTVINKDCALEILTARDKETREIFLHTAAGAGCKESVSYNTTCDWTCNQGRILL